MLPDFSFTGPGIKLKIDRANLRKSPKRIFLCSICGEILAVRPLYKSGAKPACAGHASGVWEYLAAFPFDNDD